MEGSKNRLTNMEYQIMTQFRATRLRAEASRRASRCLVPLASPLAGQISLGVFKHSANSRATPLKQGLSWPPLDLSAINLCPARSIIRSGRHRLAGTVHRHSHLGTLRTRTHRTHLGLSAMMLPTINARSDSGEEIGQAQADEEIGDS